MVNPTRINDKVNKPDTEIEVFDGTLGKRRAGSISVVKKEYTDENETQLGFSFPQSSFVVNLSCVKSTDSTFTSVSLLSTHYYRENEPNIPTNIDSTFKGHFIPAETSDNAKIQGSVIVDNVANFPTIKLPDQNNVATTSRI